MSSNWAATENQITIDYALTRGEVACSFLLAIRESPEYLRKVVTLAAILAVAQMCFRALNSHHFGGSEILSGIIVFAAVLVLLPIAMFVSAKGGKRTFTISPEGIATSIGKKSGQIPWKKVKLVKDGSTFILIAGRSGNAFFIPNRAFALPDDRARFLEQIGTWRSGSH